MPFRVKKDPIETFVCIDLSGPVDVVDLAKAVVAAREGVERGQKTTQLWRTRDVTYIRVDPSSIDLLRAIARVERTRGGRTQDRHALVTWNEDVRSVAEIFADVLEDLGVEIRVFRNEEAARRWLLSA